MPDLDAHLLSAAILQTLAYSDIFEYPLTAAEIHRYLPGVRTSLEAVQQALAAGDGWVQTGRYFALPGRDGLAALRLEREGRARALLPWATRYGRVIGSLPFVRMVALTGSLAVLNTAGDSDFDYMLVTAPGHLWTARAFALLLNRIVKVSGHTICPNLIVSDDSLAWNKQDLYTAHELCQMIPIAGMATYYKLMDANSWINDFLPNARIASRSRQPDLESAVSVQKLLELPLCTKLGERLERWERDRKIARFSRQAGFGEETVFSATLCQGNFEHHGKRTRAELQNKLKLLSAENDSRSETMVEAHKG